MDMQTPTDGKADRAPGATSRDERAPSAEDSSGRRRSRLGRVARFAREHPGLSVIGVAGLGLFGGVELAFGVLIGAGVLALVEPGDSSRRHGLGARARAIAHAARERLEREGDAGRGADTRERADEGIEPPGL
jgi:hypothetical protein